MANDIIDIDVFQTVENVEITVEPNLTTVNITDVVIDTTKLAILNNLSDLNNVSTARTNLGLGNVDNTSDVNKPVSTAQATAIALKQNTLGFTPENVANKENTTLDTSTTKYPTNNLVKTALDLKANLASPTFTGVPLAPTAAANTNTTQIATTAFATGAVSGKMNTPSLTVNTIPKALTASTIGNSRIVDTGTFIGIGTINTPTKDITLRGLDNREIGVEDSNNITEGKNIKISAGRTINTVPSTGFVALGQPSYLYRDVVAMNNGDMMIFVNGGAYKQINGSGNLIAFSTTGVPTVPLVAISPSNNNILYVVDVNNNGASIMKKSTDGGASYTNISGEIARAYSDVCVMPNSDVYAIVKSSGGVWKLTGGAGNFVNMGFTTRDYQGFVVMPNGDLYITVNGGDVYKMLAGTSTLTALGQTNRTWSNGYTFGGDVYMRTSGLIYKQTSATGNFVSTGISEPISAGNHIAVSINNNVYVTSYGNDVLVQFNNGAGTPDLNGGALQLTAGTGKGTGTSDIEMYTGSKLASGTDIQSLTLRAKINNEGLMTLPSVTNALITAGGAKAIITKEYADANYSGGGGGGGSTNLSTTQTASDFTIESSTGTDAIVPLGNGTLAGASLNDFTTAEKTKVANTSGTNTGDNATNTQYSGLASSKQDALGFTPYNATNPSGYQTSVQVATTITTRIKDDVYDLGTWALDQANTATRDALYNKFELTSTEIAGKQPLSAVLTATTASFTTGDETKIDKYPSTATNAKILQGNGTNYVEVDLPASPTTIVGITGTKAQYDTSVTDGNFMYIGDAPTTHTHTSTSITDFNSATRAQTEAELVAGANITITPSGTGATRQLTIASTGGSSATSGSGTVPSGNITWGTTAPTTVLNNTYEWEEDNNVVTLRINLSYSTSATNQSVTIALPSDAPTPKDIAGFTSALDIVAFGSGMIYNVISSLPTSAGRYCLLRRNTVNTGYEIVVTHGSAVSVRTAALTIQYFK